MKVSNILFSLGLLIGLNSSCFAQTGWNSTMDTSYIFIPNRELKILSTRNDTNFCIGYGDYDWYRIDKNENKTWLVFSIKDTSTLVFLITMQNGQVNGLRYSFYDGKKSYANYKNGEPHGPNLLFQGEQLVYFANFRNGKLYDRVYLYDNKGELIRKNKIWLGKVVRSLEFN